MKAVILNVGNEVLEGKVVNTNSSFLAIELGKLGIKTIKTIVVGDDEEMLKSEIENFKQSDYELLITTGGLGPTHDDFTKEVICKCFNKELVLREEAKQDMERYFKGSYAECNLKQAYFPKDAILLHNELGTADGAIIEADGKSVIILVGPPMELKPMFRKGVIPYLEKDKDDLPWVAEYIVMGIGESGAEELLREFFEENPKVDFAPYASLGRIRYQLSAKHEYADEFKYACRWFENIMDEYIVTSNNEQIEELLVKELRDRDLTIATAESCTGGMIASTLVNVDGASAVLKEAHVTYSNESKIKYLNVDPESIEKYGVVSEEVVIEMAKGLRKLSKSDINISVSGIAGPTGGTKDKPVGLVWYAIDINGEVFASFKVFKGNREQVRIRATRYILYKLFRLLKD